MRKATWEGFALAANFLSRIFSEPPTADFLHPIRKDRLLRDWPLPAFTRENALGLELMAGYLEGWTGESEEDLSRDFTRLFLGPGAAAVPVYESCYRGRDRILFDDVTLQVREIYRSHSFRPLPRNREPEDHAGLELAFVSELARRASENVPEAPEEFHRAVSGISSFLSGHLMLWADDFSDRLKGAAETAYYRGAAHLTPGVLAGLAEHADSSL